MKLTRFAQSTLLVENKAGGSIIVDPGQYNLDPGRFTIESFPTADVVIITHKHADHFHVELLQAILAKKKATVITNSEIAGVLASRGITARVFGPGDTLDVAGFSLTGVVTDHVVRGEAIVNFGFVMSADGRGFYYTSDTRFIDAGQLPDAVKGLCLLLPISNRGVVMGIDDAWLSMFPWPVRSVSGEGGLYGHQRSGAAAGRKSQRRYDSIAAPDFNCSIFAHADRSAEAGRAKSDRQ